MTSGRLIPLLKTGTRYGKISTAFDGEGTGPMSKSYKGNGPYIFVSYSHDDSETVLKILDFMVSADYRIWYDERIRPGSPWREKIQDYINNCTVCIAFLSSTFVDSTDCRDEIGLARKKQKVILPVYLEKGIELKHGLDLTLHGIQRIDYSDTADFMQKIRKNHDLDQCRSSTNNAYIHEAEPQTEKVEQEKAQGNDEEQTGENTDIKTAQTEGQNDGKAQTADNQADEIIDSGTNGYDTFLSNARPDFHALVFLSILLFTLSFCLIIVSIIDSDDLFNGALIQSQTDRTVAAIITCTFSVVILGGGAFFNLMKARRLYSLIQTLLSEAPYEAQWYRTRNTLIFAKYKQDGTSIYWHTYPDCRTVNLDLPDEPAPISSVRISSLRTVRIEDGIKTIKKGAFAGFEELSSVFISDSVQVIEEGAFGESCKSLKKVSVSSKTKIEDEAFPPWVKPEIRPEQSEEEENVPPPPD